MQYPGVKPAAASVPSQSSTETHGLSAIPRNKFRLTLSVDKYSLLPRTNERKLTNDWTN